MDSLRKRPSPRISPPPNSSPPLQEKPAFDWRERPKKQDFTTAPRERRRTRRLVGIILGILFLASIALFLGWSFFAGMTLTRSLHFENRELSFFESLKEVSRGLFQKTSPVAGEAEGRINILILGKAGESYPGKNLTDSVMILSLDTKEKRAAILSLPRDLFVPIMGTGTSTRVNSLYQYGLSRGEGVEPLRESLSEVTGLQLHYFAVIDFDGFEKVVDALDGIQVEVLRDIHDTRYPGKNYSYETFSLKAGWQTLDGATALKYARERHGDPEGDFGRAKRQQQILQAMREKAFSLPTFLNPFTLHSFLESLGQSITTDIQPTEIRRFLELARTFDTENVDTVVIDAWKKDSLLRVDHVQVGDIRAFILVPRSGTWDEIQNLTAHIFEQGQQTKQREEMEKEAPSLLVIATAKNSGAAFSLERSLKKEFPSLSVELSFPRTLENKEETAIILDKTNLAKPFTLDALIKRYALERVETLSGLSLPSVVDKHDFIVVYTEKDFTDNNEEIFQKDAVESTYDFQEPLPPQPTKKR